MKKILTTIVGAVVVGGVVWWAWLRSPAEEHADEEKHHDFEVPVRTGQVARVTLRAFVTAYGMVEPEPPGDRVAANSKLAAPVAGVVTDVLCAEGDLVAQGQVLFRLDNRAAEAALVRASNAVVFAEKNLARQTRLLESGGTSIRLQQEAEQALASSRGDFRATQIQEDLLCVKAPLAGTLTRITARPGQAVDPSSPLAEIIDTNRIVASVAVPVAELLATGVHTGQQAEVRADELLVTNATVVFLGPDSDPKTATTTVRIRLQGAAGFRPGQPVTARIITKTHADCLAVPETAVVKDQDGRECVAVVTGERAKLLPVKTGLRENSLVEVDGAGLSEQTSIVSEGAYGLPSETRVRVLRDGAPEPETGTNAPSRKDPKKSD